MPNVLKFKYLMKPRRMAHAEGPGSGQLGRINKLSEVLTKLFRYERYEGVMGHCDEVRSYAELLIQRAIHHGDTHKETMQMADFWLLEKDLIHKLFKVFVPRYQSYTTCVTNIFTLPTVYPGPGFPMGIIELKGNPWPPVIPRERETKNLLTNVLLEQARLDYTKQKQRILHKKTNNTNTSSISTTIHDKGDSSKETSDSASSDDVKSEDILNTDVKHL